MNHPRSPFVLSHLTAGRNCLCACINCVGFDGECICIECSHQHVTVVEEPYNPQDYNGYQLIVA